MVRHACTHIFSSFFASPFGKRHMMGFIYTNEKKKKW